MNKCPQGHTLWNAFSTVPGCYACHKNYQLDSGYKCDTCKYYICDLCHQKGPNRQKFIIQAGKRVDKCPEMHSLFKNFNPIPSCQACHVGQQNDGYKCDSCKYYVCDLCYSKGPLNVQNTGFSGQVQGNVQVGYGQQGGNFTVGFGNVGLQQQGFQGAQIKVSSPQKVTNIPTIVQQVQLVPHKFCPNNHLLNFGTPQTRANCSCNTCGKGPLLGTWYCRVCDWDLCMNCYDKGCSTPSSSIKVCKNYHMMIMSDSFSRANVSCDNCRRFVSEGKQYTCFQCNYDLCFNCHAIHQNPFDASQYLSGYSNQQVGFQPQQVGFQPQQVGFQNQQVGFQPQQVGFQPQQVGFQNQQVGFQPQQVGFQGGQVGFQAQITTSPQKVVTTTQLVDYKRCPSGHHLFFGTAQVRANCRCNTCGKGPLPQTWFCKACDWDLCFDCYDIGCAIPSSKVKVCNNYHMLIYTDSRTRANVACNVCNWAVKDGKQYTCFECDYDMCMNCYAGYQNPNNCNIF